MFRAHSRIDRPAGLEDALSGAGAGSPMDLRTRPAVERFPVVEYDRYQDQGSEAASLQNSLMPAT